MISTKSYQYLDNGLLASTDVTVDVGPCPINDPDGVELTTTYLNITSSLPAPVAGDVYVDIMVTDTHYSYGSSGTVTYYTQIKIPAGQTNVVKSLKCNEKRKDEGGAVVDEYRYGYEFVEQRSVPEENQPMTITYTKVDASCFAAANGSISLSISGGTGPFTFDWNDDGPAVQSRTGMPAGMYYVTVTDSNNISSTLSDIPINHPPIINPNGTVVHVSCYGENDGSISHAPTGGVGGFKYKWSDGSTLRNRTALAAGQYRVTITDDNGCSASPIYTINQATQIKVITNIAGKNVTVSVTGGTPAYSYFWSDNVAQKDRTNLAEGSYSLTVTDANGCKETITIFIKDFKFYFSKNPVLLELVATDLINKPNLSFALEVFVEDVYLSESFNLKYSTEHTARIDGSTDFDVREVLNAFLNNNVPLFNDSQVRQVSDAFKRFYLQHSEVFGNPPMPAPVSQVDTYFVLFGGLSEQEHAKKRFFDNYLGTQRPFFTWQPNVKDVVERQHEYLHFVTIDQAITALNLDVSLKYDDGTEFSVNAIRTVNNVQPNEVYRFPAGYHQLNLSALANGKLIVSYTLKLSFGSFSSETRTYVVIPDQDHYRIFLYQNSIGGWDTQLAKGRGKSKLRTREESIDRELPVNYRYSTRAKEVTSKTGERTDEIVIGNLTTSEKRHLVDLAISEQVYEQRVGGYLPVDVKFYFDPADAMEALDEEVGFEVTYPIFRKYTPEL